MLVLRVAGILGAVTAVVGVTVAGGPPPLDAVLEPGMWIIYGVLACAGAFWAVSMVLAWRTTHGSPRWLLATLLGVLLISQPFVWSFIHESRQTQRFLSTAASTQGVVANKYIRGGVHLIVEYEVRGQPYRIRVTGQNPLVGTQAFGQWREGERIPVYYQPAAPQRVLVGQPGPEPMFLFEDLAKQWVFWGVLLTAYLPLTVRGLHRRISRQPPNNRVQATPGQAGAL